MSIIVKRFTANNVINRVDHGLNTTDIVVQVREPKGMVIGTDLYTDVDPDYIEVGIDPSYGPNELEVLIAY